MKLGKPSLSGKEIDLIFRKLEPYLRVGLNPHAAVLKADTPKSTVYDLYAENGKSIEEIKEAKSTNKKAILTYSEFLELLRNR